MAPVSLSIWATEAVMAFTGAKGASSWLRQSEAADKADPSYSQAMTISGIDPYYGAKLIDKVHKIYGDRVARQTYAPGFVLPLVLKDVRLALAEAENAGAPMPSVGVVRDRLITGIARGYGELDWTSLGLIAAEEAGLYAVPATAGE